MAARFDDAKVLRGCRVAAIEIYRASKRQLGISAAVGSLIGEAQVILNLGSGRDQLRRSLELLDRDCGVATVQRFGSALIEARPLERSAPETHRRKSDCEPSHGVVSR